MKKLEDLVHLSELCVDLLQQNEEHYAEVSELIISIVIWNEFDLKSFSMVTSDYEKDLWLSVFLVQCPWSVCLLSLISNIWLANEAVIKYGYECISWCHKIVKWFIQKIYFHVLHPISSFLLTALLLCLLSVFRLLKGWVPSLLSRDNLWRIEKQRKQCWLINQSAMSSLFSVDFSPTSGRVPIK